MSTISAILAHLNTPKYDAVRDQIRAGFLARIESDFRAWSEDALNFVVPPNLGWVKNFPTAGESSHYRTKVGALEETGSLGIHAIQHASSAYYEAVQAALRSYELAVDKQKVQDAADREWEDTKAFYAHRVGEKIDLLLEGDAEVTCNVSGSRLLLGTITAALGSKRLVLGTSLKINYRYGVFAADRKLTVYRQVPTVVESYSGFDLPAREAQIERETAAAKEDRKSEMAKFQGEIKNLERQKRVWGDTYFSLNWAKKRGEQVVTLSIALPALNEKLTKAGATETLARYPTWEEAKAKVKELRASLKAAKLKLSEVRRPKVEPSARSATS